MSVLAARKFANDFFWSTVSWVKFTGLKNLFIKLPESIKNVADHYEFGLPGVFSNYFNEVKPTKRFFAKVEILTKFVDAVSSWPKSQTYVIWDGLGYAEAHQEYSVGDQVAMKARDTADWILSVGEGAECAKKALEEDRFLGSVKDWAGRVVYLQGLFSQAKLLSNRSSDFHCVRKENGREVFTRVRGTMVGRSTAGAILKIISNGLYLVVDMCKALESKNSMFKTAQLWLQLGSAVALPATYYWDKLVITPLTEPS